MNKRFLLLFISGSHNLFLSKKLGGENTPVYNPHFLKWGVQQLQVDNPEMN